MYVILLVNVLHDFDAIKVMMMMMMMMMIAKRYLVGSQQLLLAAHFVASRLGLNGQAYIRRTCLLVHQTSIHQSKHAPQTYKFSGPTASLRE